MNVENLQWNIDRVVAFYDNHKVYLNNSEKTFEGFLRKYCRILDVNGAPNNHMSYAIFDEENYREFKDWYFSEPKSNAMICDGRDELVNGVRYLTSPYIRFEYDGYVWIIKQKTNK